jgi:hypothetical protein
MAAPAQDSLLRRPTRVYACIRHMCTWRGAATPVLSSVGWNWLMPFGGYKESGYGRENGIQVMEHDTQTTAVVVDLQETPAD